MENFEYEILEAAVSTVVMSESVLACLTFTLSQFLVCRSTAISVHSTVCFSSKVALSAPEGSQEHPGKNEVTSGGAVLPNPSPPTIESANSTFTSETVCQFAC